MNASKILLDRATSSTVLLVLSVGLVSTMGCKPKVASNSDLLSEYGGEQYEQDMVASDYEDVEDQGDSISPEVQAAIQDTVTTVYVTDYEKCLETEMSRLENRWVAGDFAVEFTIESSGLVSNVKFLEVDIKERRTLNDKGEYVAEGGKAPREATEFQSCAEAKMYKWEFDPAPEVTYVHSYNGRVGEAW